MEQSLHQYILASFNNKEADTIIYAPAYIEVLQKNPGLIHENFGSFYTQATPHELPTQLEQALATNVASTFGWQTQILPHNKLRNVIEQTNTLYLLTEQEGIHIKTPTMEALQAPTYLTGLLLSIRDIATKSKIGTLSGQFSTLDTLAEELTNNTRNA